MSLWDKMSQYGKRDVMKQVGKMSQVVCQYPDKKVSLFCHSYITSTLRVGWT